MLKSVNTSHVCFFLRRRKYLQKCYKVRFICKRTLLVVGEGQNAGAMSLGGRGEVEGGVQTSVTYFTRVVFVGVVRNIRELEITKLEW